MGANIEYVFKLPRTPRTPPTQDQLKKLEKKYGIAIPEYLRGIFLEFAGYKPRSSYFTFCVEYESWVDNIIEFMPDNTHEFGSFEFWMDMFEENNGTDFIPVANLDMGGNLLLACMKPDEYGTIWTTVMLSMHAGEEITSFSEKIAPSYEAFEAMLHEPIRWATDQRNKG